jgi:hypothetical protein
VFISGYDNDLFPVEGKNATIYALKPNGEWQSYFDGKHYWYHHNAAGLSANANDITATLKKTPQNDLILTGYSQNNGSSFNMITWKILLPY